MSVAKSIRVPEEIYAYIDNYRGEGFNQKFINIIQDAKDTEPERTQRLEKLNSQISDREKYLLESGRKLDKVLADIRSLGYSSYSHF